MPNRLQIAISRVFGISETKAPSGASYPSFIPLSSRGVYSNFAPPDPQASNLADYYKSWVYTCTNTIATEVAKIDIDLFRKHPDGEVEQVEQHEALDVLQTVNKNITMYDLWYMTDVYKSLYGEAFWWLMRDGTKVVGIYPWLNPAYMDIKTDENGEISGYRYRVQNSRDVIEFDPADILHFKNFNPSDPYRGLSTVKVANYEIATDMEAQKWNYQFFKNDAKPSGMLIYSHELDESTIQRIREQWDSEHVGTDNAHKMAILTGDVKYQDAGFSQKDMDFLEQRKFSRDAILTIFRVPLAILNPDSSINRATAEASNAVFFERVIEPRMIQMMNILNEFFLPNFDQTGELFFDFDNTSKRDLLSDTQYYASGLQNGWLSINEIREMENLEDIGEEGDKYYLPMNLSEVGSEPPAPAPFPPAGAPPTPPASPDLPPAEPNPAEPPKDASAPTKRAKGKLKNYHFHVKPRRSLGQKFYSELLPLAKEMAKKVVSERKAKSQEARTQAQQSLVAIRTNVDGRKRLGEGIIAVKRTRAKNEVALFRKLLERQFKRQETHVINSLSQKAVKDVGFDFNEETEADLFAEIFLPVKKQIVQTHGEDALRLVGDEGFSVSPNVRTYLRNRGLEFCKTVNATTKQSVIDAINAGLGAGEGIPDIKKRIGDVFDGAKGYRAEMIARTEVSQASNFAINEGFTQSGVVESKEWFTPNGEDEDCITLDGQVVGLDESFKGATDDFSEPPVHPNCECTILPVINSKLHIMPPKPIIIETKVTDDSVIEELKQVLVESKSAKNDLENLRDTIAQSIANEQTDAEKRTIEGS